MVPNGVLRGDAAKRGAVVRFKPVEGAIRLGIQHELGATLHEVSPFLRIFHQTAGFHFVRPGFDFRRRFRRAIGLQPGADVLIVFRGLNGSLELLAGDAFERKEHIIERTIVMIFAEGTRQAGAAFINGTGGNHKSSDAYTRAVRGLFGEVSGNDGGGHNLIY